MNRVNQQEADQNPEATLYIGNLDENVTEAILYELMLQAGPIVHINLPKDRVSQTHQGYGFVEYKTEADANYAASIMNQIWLFGKSIRVSKSASDKQNGFEIGATLFVGSLDPLVDESTLQQTFSVFGPFAKPLEYLVTQMVLQKGTVLCLLLILNIQTVHWNQWTNSIS